MKAGHYENRRESVDIMIRSSKETINELIGYGVEFTKKGDHFDYTREGCHSKPRILYHEDITGKEITSKLLAEVLTRKNITILENMPMVDILERENVCYGVLAKKTVNIIRLGLIIQFGQLEELEDCFVIQQIIRTYEQMQLRLQFVMESNWSIQNIFNFILQHYIQKTW